MQASARLSSSAASKKVIAGVSSAIARSCYRTSRGKAHAAPLSAESSPLKGQKRISKQERRVRIVDAVDKFRASNDGKFPTVTNVHQQVGGSYYTVREVLQELKYNHTKAPLGNAKAAPLQGAVEVAEHSRPKDEAMVAQLKGTPEFGEHSRPKDDSVKSTSNRDSSKSSQEIQVEDDVLISPKDAAMITGIMEKTETWKPASSSHQNVESEAGKHDLNTSATFKTADGPNLSDQTESESVKVITNKSSLSLGVEAKSDPGNQQSEAEANKLTLENTEKSLNASESSASDQRGSDNVTKANVLDREHNPKHEPEESTGTGLFGSLKSFANGFRSFWKNL